MGHSPRLAEADPVGRSRQARTKISDTLVEILGDTASDAGSTPAASTNFRIRIAGVAPQTAPQTRPYRAPGGSPPRDKRALRLDAAWRARAALDLRLRGRLDSPQDNRTEKSPRGWHPIRHGCAVQCVLGERDQSQRRLVTLAQNHGKEKRSPRATRSDLVAVQGGQAEKLVTHREACGSPLPAPKPIRVNRAAPARIDAAAGRVGTTASCDHRDRCVCHGVRAGRRQRSSPAGADGRTAGGAGIDQGS